MRLFTGWLLGLAATITVHAVGPLHPGSFSGVDRNGVFHLNLPSGSFATFGDAASGVASYSWTNASQQPESAVNALRRRYYDLDELVANLALDESSDDVTRIRAAGESVQQAVQGFNTIRDRFSVEEAQVLESNFHSLLDDVRSIHDRAVRQSRDGTVVHPVSVIRTGRRGRPRYHIDPRFLSFAVTQRTSTSIAEYLTVSRSVVSRALVREGIREPGNDPFIRTRDANGQIQYEQRYQFTAALSHWSDPELDDAILRLRLHYPLAGITMLEGALRELGQRVPRARIAESLRRVAPQSRLWGRTRIQRRVYSVPGPNFLWHHDGQHGLIRWGIVLHGFIDGYSRLIVGLRAHPNNRGETVLRLFLDAVQTYGVPSRVRGDHGVENLQVAAFMVLARGPNRGSYMWGRSVHNVRIERLWGDTTKQFGAKWSEFFTMLESGHGLNPSNPYHIWLLHTLFLREINDEIDFFVRNWNNHRIQLRGQRSRSPLDMFNFDMLTCGIRGRLLNLSPSQPLLSSDPQDTERIGNEDGRIEDLQGYGIDWAHMRASTTRRPADRPASESEANGTWMNDSPPPHMNEVQVELGRLEFDPGPLFHTFAYPLVANLYNDPRNRRDIWIYALGAMRARSSLF